MEYFDVVDKNRIFLNKKLPRGSELQENEFDGNFGTISTLLSLSLEFNNSAFRLLISSAPKYFEHTKENVNSLSFELIFMSSTPHKSKSSGKVSKHIKFKNISLTVFIIKIFLVNCFAVLIIYLFLQPICPKAVLQAPCR